MFPSVSLGVKEGATAKICHYGAHLTSWLTSSGKQWIFVSDKARFESGTAIRGGVPIIFPQFNAFGSGSRHGFARNLDWVLVDEKDGECCFRLESNDTTLADWPYLFKAEFRVVLHGDQLTMQLSVDNTGSDAFSFTCALHTYFSILNIKTVSVQGLKGLKYWDNNGSKFSDRSTQKEAELAFTGAIDRVYFTSNSPLLLIDGEHKLKISTEGFADVVIWNPGAEAAKGMVDLADSEHDKMLCIEAARIDQPILLKAGETWRGAQILSSF